MLTLLSTKQVAQLLDINEKMVYSLIAEKHLPATKITGKWLFPLHLVEQWIENSTINRPTSAGSVADYNGLLIIAGSNDILLERTLPLYNRTYPENMAIHANLGSLGGIEALGRSLCHMAASHLLQEEKDDYNFEFASETLGELPAVVNFCLREQCILIKKGNPKGIDRVADLAQDAVKIVNRPEGTGTRLLFDLELRNAGIEPSSLPGYNNELHRHMDVGLEILSGRADAGPAISAIAGLLDLDFIPLRKERFDLLITKNKFFDPGVQCFLSLLHEPTFRDLAAQLSGYDLNLSGKMVFPV